MRLTVLFQDPFWVGIFERTDERGFAIAREVFGSEPTNREVYEFVLRHYKRLRFSEPIDDAAPTEGQSEKRNMKRAIREARRELERTGVSSKAHEAMRIELERRKIVRTEKSRDEREAEAQRAFDLRQQKKKEKKRGH